MEIREAKIVSLALALLQDGYKKDEIEHLFKFGADSFKTTFARSDEDMYNIGTEFGLRGTTIQECVEAFKGNESQLQVYLEKGFGFWNEHAEEELSEEVESEEQDEEELEQDEEKTTDLKKLSPKAKKLIEKVDKLCEKIAQEKNPLKLHLLKFQVRMLQAKIQRELDLINLKESYEVKREELKSSKAQKDAKNETSLAKLANQIRLKQQVLKSNSECDYKSADFMYDNDTIQRHGGLENLAKTLQENGDADVQETGKRIAEMAQARKELADLQKQYKEKQAALKNSKKEYDTEAKALDSEEKRLTVVNKYNIFSRIGDFFKNIGAGIKDIRDNIAEARQLKEEYKQQEAQAKKEYEEKMAAIAQKRKEAQNEQTDKRNSRFFKDVKLTGKALEQANEPVQTEEPSQEAPAPVQENEQPVQEATSEEPEV